MFQKYQLSTRSAKGHGQSIWLVLEGEASAGQCLFLLMPISRSLVQMVSLLVKGGRERRKNVITTCPLVSQKVIRKEMRGELGSVVITAISGDYLSISLCQVPSLGRGNYQPRWLAGLGHQGGKAIISNSPDSICCLIKGFKWKG